VIGRSEVGGPSSRLSHGVLSTLGFALIFVVVNTSPAWGARSGVVASTTANATGGGALLLAMGAGVLILGGGGFTILTWSRRKRKPQQCAAEREALAMAEQALRYWEGALMHLQSASRSSGVGAIEHSGGDTSLESQSSLLEKATAGHASALKTRDERQLDLIRCMASGSAGTSASSPGTPRLEPVTFETDRPTTPPTTVE
jgi:hypothetical protein